MVLLLVFNKIALLVLLLELEHSSRITSLNSVFIKVYHQIYHDNTALDQMSLFLMTNWSQLFSFCDISSNEIINESSFNNFFCMTDRIYPCFSYYDAKILRNTIGYGIIILFIRHIKYMILEGLF